MTLSESIGMMITEIASVLVENKPTIYLYGSVSHNDFRYGWSDIDILVLTETEISEKQANALVLLRQDMLKKYPDNLYLRLFEGGMLSAHAFMNNTAERTIYWGTSGERITDRYELNSLSMTELLDSGVLLFGDDIRGNIARPTYAQMRDDIRQHVQSARKYGRSVGWLLDIARGSYTLKTGKIISKAAAGEWVLSNGIYPEADFIEKAMAIRKEPTKYTREQRTIDNAVIQRFADLIDAEFANTIELFAMCEGKPMPEQTIETHINDALTGDTQKLALDFVAFLKAQEMQFERGTGYWADKRYWMISYKAEYVCFISVNGFGFVRHQDEPEGFYIWSDDSGTDWYANAPLDDHTKEIAFKNVDFCGKCSPESPCYGGTDKIIFGKEFDKVYRTTFRFDNPNVQVMECVKKLIELRKSDISQE